VILLQLLSPLQKLTTSIIVGKTTCSVGAFVGASVAKLVELISKADSNEYFSAFMIFNPNVIYKRVSYYFETPISKNTTRSVM
jgi:hypothetical protein